MKSRGFSLVELLIFIGIFSILGAMTVRVFNVTIHGVKNESFTSQSRIDNVTGIQLLRMDLELAGFGIALDNGVDPVVSWDATNNILVIRSTANNSNDKSLGWVVFDCTAGAALSASVAHDARQYTNNAHPSYTPHMVLLDADKNFVNHSRFGTGTCPANSTYLGFPVDPLPLGGLYTAPPSTTNDGCSSASGTRQFCHSVTYSLSATQTLTNCAPGTRNLLRNNMPVLSCVADFEVSFDRDLNQNDILENNEFGLASLTTPAGTAPTDKPTANAVERIPFHLKNINVNIAQQVGRMDTGHNMTVNTASLFANGWLIDGVTYNPPGAANLNPVRSNYRWKFFRVNGKPMSW